MTNLFFFAHEKNKILSEYRQKIEMKKKEGFSYTCKLSVSRFLSGSLLPHFLIVCLLACSMLRTFRWRRYNSHHHRLFFFTSVPIVIEVEVLCFGLLFCSCEKRKKE
jgi:hypothetical protein